jgi:hypothetical protein
MGFFRACLPTAWPRVFDVRYQAISLWGLKITTVE